LVPCKLTPNPISPIENPCCNPTLKIGVVLPWDGRCDAVQSKQQSAVEVAFTPADYVTHTSIFAGG
jgi:hypothetical protein